MKKNASIICFIGLFYNALKTVHKQGGTSIISPKLDYIRQNPTDFSQTLCSNIDLNTFMVCCLRNIK
jgi:hypothetical protein